MTLVDRAELFSTTRQLLDDRERWLPVMGRLVLKNTLEDLRDPGEFDDEE